ncbi:GNAT family N-acetyltransferase [Alkalicoccobacillus porphyridii]|uniref:GNAT family N-acetyltransferase n=1 Tax=Alkalicoccobacillus porphyridii TaxID=2597270 RepID=A0A553ZYW5_9BACI|nr:GNAT family N-acetyltransferase [Alkalicoccobacillus porphyridii]TSB46634.1 GNAT family N-acetyltransferase [Alkalicoccobacillus porphyridii]
MKGLEIRRPLTSDKQELTDLFQEVIKETFKREKISHLVADQQQELNMKMHYLESDLAKQKIARYFLIAIDSRDDKIVGTIEYGNANEIIQDILKEELSQYPEIGTVFVLPKFQGKGIGTMLLDTIIKEIKLSGFKGYCLDSGYKQSQQFWIRKIGQPTFIQENYWDKDNHHMVWKRELE